MNYSDVIVELIKDTYRKLKRGDVLATNLSDIDSCVADNINMYCAEKDAIKTLEYLQKQGIENLAALAEEMEHFNRLKKHETQWLDKIGDPLEPLKISSALDSEILKFEYLKKHDPKSISILDYTIIAALVEALEKRTGNGRRENNK